MIPAFAAFLSLAVEDPPQNVDDDTSPTNWLVGPLDDLTDELWLLVLVALVVLLFVTACLVGALAVARRMRARGWTDTPE